MVIEYDRKSGSLVSQRRQMHLIYELIRRTYSEHGRSGPEQEARSVKLDVAAGEVMKW